MKIAIFGDSVLEGVRYENGKYSRSHELLQLFQAEHGVELVNMSRFGATVDKGLAKLKNYLEQNTLGSYTILEYGGNDSAFRWDEVAANPDAYHACATPPDKFTEIYKAMIDLVYKNGSWPILCTLPPISAPRYIDYVTRNGIDKSALLRWMHGDIETVSRWQGEYSRMVEKLAEDRGCMVLDLRAAFPPSGDELDAFLCSDGIHPNLAGQQLIYRRATAAWNTLIAAREGRTEE